MQKNNKEIFPYEYDVIDLRKLFISLAEKKLFIFSFTGLLTLFAIIYAINITPTYSAVSSFKLPSTSSILAFNKIYVAEDKKESIFSDEENNKIIKNSVFSDFLLNISSKEFHKKVFIDGDYLTVFNPENNSIDDVNDFILSNLQSITLHTPNLSSKDLKLGLLNELPYSISIQGSNAEAISMYLNDLVKSANNYTIEKFLSTFKQDIDIRQNQIKIKREMLLSEAKLDRLAKIKKIKEEDALKIKEINSQIERARFKAKEDRLNEIVALNDAATLARSLGIIENNFKLTSGSNLTIINGINGENNVMPDWYLYGEKALLEKAELLKSRTSDDPFIPELVILKNQLNEVNNNHLLQSLEKLKDDSPYIDEIIELDIERTKLNTIQLDSRGIESMQISQVASAMPINSNKRMIVISAFISSFMMSIFLVLIMGLLRPRKAD